MKARKIRTMDREGNVVDVLGLKGAQGANGQPGANGTTPHIGENGNWFIGDTDTGIPARGEGGGSGSGIIAETDPTVFAWAKSHLPFTVAQLSAMANGAGFVVNPTNFADGKTYFRYHAGANSFTWTNPNPQRGAVTITVLAWAQYGDKSIGDSFSRLIVVYGDGTTEPIWLKNGQTVTLTTDAGKVLEEIRGNYDHENWVLLDMSVLSIVADYPAPSGSVKSVNGIEPDEAGNVEIDIPESTDANAVHYTADTPTEEQQMQARANLDLYWKEKVYNVIASFLYVGWWEADSADNLWRGGEMNVTISGVGTFATRCGLKLDGGSHVANYKCVCYGNSSLVTDIPEAIKPNNLYPDYPFLVYAFDGDYGTKGWTVVFDDSISKTMGTTVTFTSTTEYTEKYHPVPSEYLPALTGATSDADGESGLVPAPAAGDQGKFLAGDGTWKTPEFSGGGSGTASEKEWTKLGDVTVNGATEFIPISFTGGIVTLDTAADGYDDLSENGYTTCVVHPIDPESTLSPVIGKLKAVDYSAGTFEFYNTDSAFQSSAAYDPATYKITLQNVGSVVMENVPTDYKRYKARVTAPVLVPHGLRDFYRCTFSYIGLGACLDAPMGRGAIVETELYRYPYNENYMYKRIRVAYGKLYGGGSTNETQSFETVSAGVGKTTPPENGVVSFSPSSCVFCNGMRFELWGANDD